MRLRLHRFLTYGAGLLALLCAFAADAQTSPPPAPTGDLHGDLRIFESKVIESDVSYSPAARREAHARLEALAGRLNGLNRQQIEVELCRLAALADNAHTGCAYPPPAPAIAAGFYPLEGRIYVFWADRADADLVGGRLAAIDGQPIEAVREKVRSLQGGRAGWRDLSTISAYASPAILQALGVARDADAADYSIETPDGRIIRRRLTAPEGSPTGPVEVIMAPDRTPWIWADMSDPYRWRDAPEHGALVVQLRSNLDLPGRPLASFLDEVERHRAALGRKTVIIDMRSNTGGDMTLSREFFANWPGRVGDHARFLVLLGPRSLSATLADVAYLKQAGGSQVTIVGQPPGDGMTFFAETAMVRLPGTGLLVRTALERDDLKDGCRPYADCFAGLAQPGEPTGSPAQLAAIIKRMPVSVPTLEPDVRVALRIEDYLAGKDAGLAAALDLARSCGKTAAPASCEAEARALAGPRA